MRAFLMVVTLFGVARLGAPKSPVEKEFLKALIAQRLISASEARAEGGLRFVIESVEEISRKLIEQNMTYPRAKDVFGRDLLSWQGQLLSGCGAHDSDLATSAGASFALFSTEWIKRSVSVQLEKMVYPLGFEGAFGLINSFYKNLVLVYPFEFKSEKCAQAYAILREYIACVSRAAVEKRLMFRQLSVVASGSVALSSVCVSATPPGSSPGMFSVVEPDSGDELVWLFIDGFSIDDSNERGGAVAPVDSDDDVLSQSAGERIVAFGPGHARGGVAASVLIGGVSRRTHRPNDKKKLRRGGKVHRVSVFEFESESESVWSAALEGSIGEHPEAKRLRLVG